MKKVKLNTDKGILFWITGFPGSGKTVIAEKINSEITKTYGPTVLFSGDDIRKIFNLKKYSKNERLKNGLMISKLCKFITDQKINVIFAGVGLIHKLHQQNRLNIKNYVEIYIKSNLSKIIKLRKKKIYEKYNKYIYGMDIMAELPKSPNIILNNKFDKSIEKLATELLIKIKEIVKN